MAKATDSNTLSPDLLRQIFKRSAARLLDLAEEGADDLLAIIHRKAEAAQDDEKQKLVVTFNHSIKVDFCKNTQEDTLGASTRLKLVLKGDLGDPRQVQMFPDEDPTEN